MHILWALTAFNIRVGLGTVCPHALGAQGNIMMMSQGIFELHSMQQRSEKSWQLHKAEESGTVRWKLTSQWKWLNNITLTSFVQISTRATRLQVTDEQKHKCKNFNIQTQQEPVNIEPIQVPFLGRHKNGLWFGLFGWQGSVSIHLVHQRMNLPLYKSQNTVPAKPELFQPPSLPRIS